eukprot:1151187-Pelagomonas_calceolata.AAC.4
MTVVVRVRRRPVISSLKLVMEGGYGADTACVSLYTVVNAGLRYRGINDGEGVQCLIEVGINDAANVKIVYLAISRNESSFFSVFMCEDFLDSIKVALFSGWKVDIGCKSI